MTIQIKIIAILLVCFIILSIVSQIKSYNKSKALFEKNKASRSDYYNQQGSLGKNSNFIRPSKRMHIIGVFVFVIICIIVFLISNWAIKNISNFLFWVHSLIIILYFSIIVFYRYVHKILKINPNILSIQSWALPLSDLVVLIIGFWAFCNGAKNGIGEYREAYVERMVSEVRNDSTELESISKEYGTLITDTTSVNHYKNHINRIERMGCPHLHGTLDTSFFYMDERIRDITAHNIKLASSLKEDIQSLYKLVYIKQLREQYTDELIYYMDNGNTICFNANKWQYNGNVTTRYNYISDDLRKIGLKQIVFKWGDDENQLKAIDL